MAVIRQMLCEDCNLQDATFFGFDVARGEVAYAKLCQECLRQNHPELAANARAWEDESNRYMILKDYGRLLIGERTLKKSAKVEAAVSDLRRHMTEWSSKRKGTGSEVNAEIHSSPLDLSSSSFTRFSRALAYMASSRPSCIR